MKYAVLVRQILDEAGGCGLPLVDLLSHIDALNKSVPTLEELNEALEECKCPKVSQAEHQAAVEKNYECVLQHVKTSGFSREQVAAILERHARLHSK